MTLTPRALAEAEHVVFLAVGAEKAWPVARALAGEASAETPASLIRPRTGRTTALLDRAAAACL